MTIAQTVEIPADRRVTLEVPPQIPAGTTARFELICYRLYYTIRQNRIIFLMCGGDKSTQKADIKTAHKLVKEIL